jgi:16S rRNA G966 N2-methylase RsmD
MELSELLRRTAISLYGREAIANLAGDDWLQFLNQKGVTTAFTKDVGRVLADQPYRAEVNYNSQALLTLIQHWLDQQRLTIIEQNNQKGDRDA